MLERVLVYSGLVAAGFIDLVAGRRSSMAVGRDPTKCPGFAGRNRRQHSRAQRLLEWPLYLEGRTLRVALPVQSAKNARVSARHWTVVSSARVSHRQSRPHVEPYRPTNRFTA